MNEPWFNPNLYSWIPGTALGVLVGIWGAMAGTLAAHGKAKTLVIGSWAILLFASILLLLTAIIALIQQQPYGIWYGFGLAGLIGTCVLGPLFFTIRLRYRQAEAQ